MKIHSEANINHFARTEGWSVSERGNIERDDRAGTFTTDTAALAHVLALANAGSSLHVAALMLSGQVYMIDREAMVKAALAQQAVYCITQSKRRQSTNGNPGFDLTLERPGERVKCRTAPDHGFVYDCAFDVGRELTACIFKPARGLLYLVDAAQHRGG